MLKFNHFQLSESTRSPYLLALLCSILLLSQSGFSQSSCECPKVRDFDTVLKYDAAPKKYFWKLQKSANKACQAKGYSYAAEYTLNQNETDSVEFFLKKYVNTLNSLKCSRAPYHKYYYLYSHYYYLIDDQGKMVQSTYQALKVAEAIKDDGKMYAAFSNLCLGYKNLKQPNLIKKYARRMYEITMRTPDAKKRLKMLGDCSTKYLNLYQDFKVNAYLDTVKIQVDQALDMAITLKDTQSMIICYRKMEAYNFYKGNYPRALENLKKALELNKILKDSKELMSGLYGDITHVYLKMKEYSMAKIYLDSAMVALETDPRTNADGKMNLYSLKVEVAREMNDFKTAYEYAEKIREFEDSVFTVEKHNSIYEFEQKYQKAQDLKKISDLGKDKQISDLRIRSLLGLILVALLIVVILAFAWRQNRIKNKLALVESEQRLNRARINPHFFFNALTSIQALAEEEKSERVPTLISKFSKIMRASLESTYSDLVTVESEVEFITNYLSIQRTRYDQKFNFDVQISDDLEADSVKIPSMILQPFLENSIEHGFKGLDKNGRIEIEFKEVNQELHVTITDNGLGFNQIKNPSAYPSRAKQIVTERLGLLNKKYHSNAKFDWKSGLNGGVRVSIVLPLLD